VSTAVPETWHRFDIRRIDDLSNAVFAADLEAIQMPGLRVRGSLAFAARDGVVISSGLIDGNVIVRGPLSDDAVTLGVVLRAGARSRLWLNRVREGGVGVVLPGEECEFLCAGRVLYVAATLTERQLKKEAARDGLKLNPVLTNRTGLHPTQLEPSILISLERNVARIHDTNATATSLRVGGSLLRAVISHYVGAGDGEVVHSSGQGRIVRDACRYIGDNLTMPISVDALSDATSASRRTLFRAFSELLGDTPRDYIRRLRLHRVRRDLISTAATTVSDTAHHWGFGQDLGRFARNYQDLFGESPSSTLALGRALQQIDTPL